MIDNNGSESKEENERKIMDQSTWGGRGTRSNQRSPVNVSPAYTQPIDISSCLTAVIIM